MRGCVTHGILVANFTGEAAPSTFSVSHRLKALHYDTVCTEDGAVEQRLTACVCHRNAMPPLCSRWTPAVLSISPECQS